MDILQSFLLGLLQGLTEFLPISSSGHLALGKYFLGESNEAGLTFEIVVHFGTLCSILIYYRALLMDITKAGFSFIAAPKKEMENPKVKMIGFVLLSMIPAFIVGFTLKDKVETIFDSPFLVSVMLVVTGFILFLTKFAKEKEGRVTVGRSIVIGIAQAFAMIPGISRSGSTISTALYFGVSREEAANFSFLMVIPVIGGAMLLQVLDLMEQGMDTVYIQGLLVGFLTAFVSGYYALKYLIVILKKKGFHYFAYYCWAVGGAGLIYFTF
ncbi:undecaprenyl-diphosphate phosphatase [Balneola vulgaris]|jgi:undecaprenyl-diphosphatase|uniref:undecaprenyl-diphosphate phosphatase n=1 Tax=Balneola vulgaris TaxID=287535 RepID=UPI00036C8392|nr:undecaprenyl-diphosphate phosphatase [Balneola vulgaris]